MNPDKASASRSPKSRDESRLIVAVEEYLRQSESDRMPSIDEFVSRYPDLNGLRDCLAGVTFLRRTAPDLWPSLGPLDADNIALRAAVEPASIEPLGDFRILREVARGGMGVVYEAVQRSLGRRVALKVLPLASALDPRHLQRFKNEALAAASPKHPHIVTVYSVGCERGVHFYAMDFIEGQTLAELISQLRSLRNPIANDRRHSFNRNVVGHSSEATERSRTIVLPDGRPPDVEEDRQTYPVASSGDELQQELPQQHLPQREVAVSGLSNEIVVDRSAIQRRVPERNENEDVSPSRTDRLDQTGHWTTERSTTMPHERLPRESRAARVGAGMNQAAETEDTVRAGQALASTVASLSGRDFFRGVAKLGIEAADALEHAHQMGIVHRDIKPSNLMLDNQGHLWVTDFGLARVESDVSLTMTGDMVGTLRYMSPEQATGAKVVDERSDVYSLGLTLYELATLQPAFAELDNKQLLDAVINREPPAPRTIDPRIPRDLETIIVKATAKSPNDRYGSAAQLADDLQRFLNLQPVRARRVSRLRRGLRWCERHPWATALIVVLLLVAMSVAFVMVRLETARRLAKAEADGERGARLAEHFFGLVNDARRVEQAHEPGWTQLAVAKLREANRLPQAGERQLELRNDLVRFLTAVDLVPRGVLRHHEHVYCLAFRPDGKQLAVGYNLMEGQVPVELWDPATSELRTKLEFPADPNYVNTNGRRGDGVRRLAYSADGRYLSVGTRSGNLHCWDLSATPPQLASWRGHADELRAVIFSRDSQQLFSAARDGTLCLWDLASHSRVRSTQLDSPLHAAGLGISGNTPVLGVADRLALIDLATLDPLPADLPITEAECLTHSPKGLTAAVCDGGQLSLIRPVAGGEIIGSLLDRQIGQAHQGVINELAFSPCGSLLASGGADKTLKIWDPISGELLVNHWLGGNGNICPAFSPDGSMLAVTAEDETRLFAVAGNALAYWCNEHVGPILMFDVSRRYDSVVASSAIPGESSRKSVNVTRLDRLKPVVVHANGIKADSEVLALGPATPKLFAVSDGISGMHSLTKGQNPRRLPDALRARWAQFTTPTELWVACAWHVDGLGHSIGGIRVIDTQSRTVIREWSNTESVVTPGVTEISSLEVGATRVVAGSHDETIKLLSREPLALIRSIPSGAGRVLTVSMNDDERYLVAGTDQGDLLLVRGADGAVLDRASRIGQAVVSADFAANLSSTSDGPSIATGTRDGRLRLWQIRDERLSEWCELPRQSAPIVRVEFSPRAGRLVSLTQGDRALRVWSLGDLQRSLQP